MTRGKHGKLGSMRLGCKLTVEEKREMMKALKEEFEEDEEEEDAEVIRKHIDDKLKEAEIELKNEMDRRRENTEKGMIRERRWKWRWRKRLAIKERRWKLRWRRKKR